MYIYFIHIYIYIYVYRLHMYLYNICIYIYIWFWFLIFLFKYTVFIDLYVLFKFIFIVLFVSWHEFVIAQGFNNFRSVATALNDADIPFYLCKSSLLGYARMCDLEPSDNDISICVRAADVGIISRGGDDIPQSQLLYSIILSLYISSYCPVGFIY